MRRSALTPLILLLGIFGFGLRHPGTAAHAGDTDHARPAAYPYPADRPDRPEAGGVTVLPQMDPRGLELSTRLYRVHRNPEFDRVYLEHARHIRAAQQSARAHDLAGEYPREQAPAPFTVRPAR